MAGVHDLWLFVFAALLLNVTPGPDMALIVARSTRYGTRAGVVAALGVMVGSFIHIIAAAVGISAMIVASATAFAVLKWVGALYLIYMGVCLLFPALQPRPRTATRETPQDVSPGQIFTQGFFTNVLNPKVAMFFLAFLPQFVDSASPSKVAAFVVLGLIFNGMGTVWNLAVAWFAGRVSESQTLARTKVWLERCIGVFFVGIGVKLALVERP